MREKKFKRCPRCNDKTPFFQDRCGNCGLIFSRLTKTTNRAAKVALKKKEYNKVIMDKVLPVDVNKWKLFFWALFLGWFGVHYAKVGRYKMFTWGIVSAASIYIAVFLPYEWLYHPYLFLVMYALLIPSTIYFMLNVVSIFQIIFNKFKVPLAIDDNLVRQDLDRKVIEDILNEVKNGKKENDENIKEEVSNKQKKRERIKVVCASCGAFVKVYSDEKICPKCDEPLKED